MPLTSGFFAKFYVITAAVDAGSTWLAIIAMLTAVIAAFLYLRIIVSMYMSVEDAGEPAHDPGARSPPASPSSCARSSPSASASSPASLAEHRQGRHPGPRPRAGRRTRRADPAAAARRP